MGLGAIFFPSRSRYEVTITWYPEVEEPIESREKHYSLVLYMNRISQLLSILGTDNIPGQPPVHISSPK